MNGLLNKTKVYLCGAMQYENGEGWRDWMETELHKLGIITFNPYKKPFINEIPEHDQARNELDNWMKNREYDKVAARMKEVRSDDLRCCDLADFVIIYINPKIGSWGTAEELTTFTKMKKPVFIFVEGGKIAAPFWILGMIPHKYIYDSKEEVLKMIQDIDSEIKKIDSTRWRLLKPEFR